MGNTLYSTLFIYFTTYDLSTHFLFKSFKNCIQVLNIVVISVNYLNLFLKRGRVFHARENAKYFLFVFLHGNSRFFFFVYLFVLMVIPRLTSSHLMLTTQYYISNLCLQYRLPWQIIQREKHLQRVIFLHVDRCLR